MGAQVRIATKHAFVLIAHALKNLEFQRGVKAMELTEKQRESFIREVLQGNYDGELIEDDPIEEQIERCIIRAEDELTLDRIGWTLARERSKFYLASPRESD